MIEGKAVNKKIQTAKEINAVQMTKEIETLRNTKFKKEIGIKEHSKATGNI